MKMKSKIEREFRVWVKQFVSGDVIVSVNKIEGVWNVDLFQDQGKSFFEYVGNGKFEFMGEK
jgi:hypothetical protein